MRGGAEDRKSVASCSKLISGLTLANSSSSSSSMLGASVKNFVIDLQKSSSTPDILWISGCQELHALLLNAQCAAPNLANQRSITIS